MERKKYRSGEETKEKILIASKRIFYEKGYEIALYDDISQAAKVNRALIPYHFKKKSDLALAVYDSFIDQYVKTRDEIAKSFSQEEKLVFAVLFFYRLLENEKVARFVCYIVSENNFRERLLLGESEMYKKILPAIKKYTSQNWSKIMHMIWGMEIETIKMIHLKLYKDIREMGEVMLQMTLQYIGYSPIRIGRVLHKVNRVLDTYQYNVKPDFTILVSQQE